MAFSGAPTYLTSVKATDKFGEEHKINVRAQSRQDNTMDFSFGYPKTYFPEITERGIKLDGDKFLVPMSEIEKLNKFCS